MRIRLFLSLLLSVLLLSGCGYKPDPDQRRTGSTLLVRRCSTQYKRRADLIPNRQVVQGYAGPRKRGGC